ncbi:KATNB1-like protein 1 [Megalops cyprinoides]|uniref:KATNB1-like protein 1 n=1 Tax=Megalops cyprinoides TaxID=118141 RepID=UPI0018653EAE|nr:KATNB1-like protein 1 [Megalops cyprinoides]
MASGGSVVEEREVHSLLQVPPSEVLKHTIHSTAKKNMKEVDIFKKEEINKKRSPFDHSAPSYSKAKRVLSCKRRTSNSSWWRSVAAGRSCDMANKENELDCAEDVEDSCYGEPCRIHLNSKMDAVGSRYSEYFAELSKDHDAMTHVLFGRNLRLNVALTLWRRNASELVAYLIRIQDTGVLVDCLPVITKSLQDDMSQISIGCCVDLLPLVKIILVSKYEEYLVVGLHWVQSVIKKWWPELSANGRGDGYSDYRNVQVMKQQLQDLWQQGSQLSLVPGTTGEIAKAIELCLSQLQ